MPYRSVPEAKLAVTARERCRARGRSRSVGVGSLFGWPISVGGFDTSGRDVHIAAGHRRRPSPEGRRARSSRPAGRAGSTARP
jgi:hypothetical protein